MARRTPRLEYLGQPPEDVNSDTDLQGKTDTQFHYAVKTKDSYAILTVDYLVVCRWRFLVVPIMQVVVEQVELEVLMMLQVVEVL